MMIRNAHKRLSLCMIAALILVTTAAPAHHSVASYDLKKRTNYSGTVFKVEWQNPHVWIWMEVPQPDGSSKKVGIEGAAPSAMRGVGFKWNDLKKGDKVTVEVAPARDGRDTGLLGSITWADGHAWKGPFLGILSRGGPEGITEPEPK